MYGVLRRAVAGGVIACQTVGVESGAGAARVLSAAARDHESGEARCDNSAMPDTPNISEERLLACLRDQYGIATAVIERVPLGLDSTARVYRMASATGTAYLVKARSSMFYEASCAAPRYLADRGIAAVVAPLPTMRGALWTHLTDTRAGARRWVIAVYPFIVGVSGWRPPLSDAQWQTTGAIFRQIHDAPPPIERGIALRSETFEPGRYAREIAEIEARHGEADGGTSAVRTLRERWWAQWAPHRAMIDMLLSAMERLAAPLRAEAGPLVICHADLHPGNLLRNDAGGVFVVDWDDVMLAPKERDFLFVGDPPTDDAPAPGAAPFYEGYLPEAIDWVALTYYRCERIITDVIECARDVFFRGDTDEGAIADATELFGDVLAPSSGMLEAARRAAAHLPAGLSVPGLLALIP